MLWSGKCLLIFNIKNKKNKIILVGASLAPKKEPNECIGEIISLIESASYTASYSLSLLLFTAPNFLYIASKNSLISLIPLLSFLVSVLAFKKNFCLLFVFCCLFVCLGSDKSAHI